MIIGGSNKIPTDATELDSCEIFNPRTRKFTMSNAKLNFARDRHSAVSLPDGRVFVCGGCGPGLYRKETELYDPSSDSFSIGPCLHDFRHGQTATTLPSGDVFIFGGAGRLSDPKRGFLFNCDTRQFLTICADVFNKAYHFADVLPTGRIVFGGGGAGVLISECTAFTMCGMQDTLITN